MALDILILGILRASPVHGYELKRRVQRPTLTPLSNNSLYPYLRRFEDAGAVTSTLEQQDGKPSRRVYSITPTGRALFTELVSTLPPELAVNEEEFLVRLSFFNEIGPAERQQILEARARVLDAGATEVQTLLAELAESPAREWRTLAMTQRLDSLRAERTWIRTVAERVEREQGMPVLTGSTERQDTR